MVPKGGSHLLAGGSHRGNTYLGAAHGENPLGEHPQVDAELWDAHKGITTPPRGCPRREKPTQEMPTVGDPRKCFITGLKAARGQDWHLRAALG